MGNRFPNSNSLFRIVLSCLVGGWTLLFLNACSDGKGNIPTLKVGADFRFAPFETQDAQGTFQGVNPDMMAAMEKFLGRPFEYHPMPLNELDTALLEGKIDFAFSSLPNSEQRRQTLHVTSPYLKTALALLYPKQEAAPAGTPDLAGKKILILKGSHAEEEVKKLFPTATLIETESNESAAQALIAEKADAYLADQFRILHAFQFFPDQLTYDLTPLKEVDWVIALRKSDAVQERALQELIEAFYRDFKSKNGFKKLEENYFKELKPLFQAQNVPFPLP